MTSDESEKKRIKAEIVFAPLDRADLEMVAGLIASMRPEDESSLSIRNYAADYYRWMYYGNPAGDAIVFVGKHKGQIVSSFAITPKRVQFGSETGLVGKTMDMFTHPDYQGLGLIKEVTNRVFDEARRRGIDMWYVTPSKNSYPIFLNKWNYMETVPVNYIVRILDHAQVLGAMVRPAMAGRIAGTMLNAARTVFGRLPAPIRGYEFREERTFGNETDALWQRCTGYGVALVRDAAYMRWRYIDNPDTYRVEKVYAGGTLRGILVTKFTKRRGLKVGEFVDLVSPPADAEVRGAMYRHGLRRFASEGCAFAQNWAIENSASEAEMIANGLNRRRKKMAILFSPDAPRKEFYDRSAWLLTPGDGNDL